jgi:hypothetical protein
MVETDGVDSVDLVRRDGPAGIPPAGSLADPTGPADSPDSAVRARAGSAQR